VPCTDWLRPGDDRALGGPTEAHEVTYVVPSGGDDVASTRPGDDRLAAGVP
jgi:hypothetical protein